MRKLFKLAILGLAAFGGRTLYERWKSSQSPASAGGTPQPRGYDTPTGTDPNAKWSSPGYEDKSLGQAVNQDQQLVDELVDETGAETFAAAEARFKERSAGAPALARQEQDPSTS